MGSPLGPLLANTFICSLEEQLDSMDALLVGRKKSADRSVQNPPFGTD